MQQVKNYQKLAFTAILSSSVAVSIFSLVTPRVFAQQTTTSPLTVQSTGTISGTLVLPFFNPNYNKVLTRIDTDENGAYYRNIGTKQNPELVQVYKSEYVKVNVRDDGSMNYYVNFKGIPVTSFDAIIKSPVLSDGEMTTFRYDGRPDMEGAVIKAVVQDEFGVKRAFYTGILTDPETGTQYQGTFELTGQGPRYSDRNGGDSPNVFDYKSDQPGSPRSEPYKIKDDSPLVKLYINVPEGTKILNSSTTGGNQTSTSTSNGTSTSTSGNQTSTSTSNGTSTSTSGGNQTSTSTSNGTSTSTSGGNQTSTPLTTLTHKSLPTTSTSTDINTSTSSTPISSTPSTDVSNVEFSSGNSFVATPFPAKITDLKNRRDAENTEERGKERLVILDWGRSNSVVEKSANIDQATCLQNELCNEGNDKISQLKQRGPRSRVMIR
ncbi:MAG: hypothetical protein IGS23_18185 [Rivularia sp. T60_A2020_040]|nr:hypothetical protein [Rivularia sp. T60_A2020_040]